MPLLVMLRGTEARTHKPEYENRATAAELLFPMVSRGPLKDPLDSTGTHVPKSHVDYALESKNEGCRHYQ